MGRNETIIRADSKFVKEMKELAKQRYFKNLANKEPSMAEMTRLYMRTPEHQKIKFKLLNFPKKEDLR